MNFFFKRATAPEPGQRIIQELMTGLQHFQISKAITVGRPRATGGFADVYDGWLKVQGGAQKVAIKKFRVIVNEEEKVAKVQ